MLRRFVLCISVGLVATVTGTASAQPREVPGAAPNDPNRFDLVVENCTIYRTIPGVGVEPLAGVTHQIGVFRSRIISTQPMEYLRGANTRAIDLKGKRHLIVPGFYDSHVHLLGGGMRLSQVALKDAKDEA